MNTKLKQLLEQEGVGSIMSDAALEAVNTLTSIFANKDIEITQFNKYGYPGEWVSKDGRLSVTRTALKTGFGFTDMYTLTIDGETLFTTDNKLIVANATLDYLSGKTEGLLLNKKSTEEPESSQNQKEEMDIEKVALDAMDKYKNTMEKLGNYEKVEKLKKNLAALETLKETLGEDADAEDLSTINKKIAAYKLSIKMEEKKIVPEQSEPIEEDSQDISSVEENKGEESNSISQALSAIGMDSEKIPSVVSFLENTIRRNPGIANMVDQIATNAVSISALDQKPIDLTCIAESAQYALVRSENKPDSFSISIEDIKRALLNADGAYPYHEDKKRMHELGLTDSNYEERNNKLREIVEDYKQLDSGSQSLINKTIDRWGGDINKYFTADDFLNEMHAIVGGPDKSIAGIAERLQAFIAKIEDLEALQNKNQPPVEDPLSSIGKTEEALSRFTQKERHQIKVYNRKKVVDMIKEQLALKSHSAKLNIIEALAEDYGLPKGTATVILSKPKGAQQVKIEFLNNKAKEIKHGQFGEEDFVELALKIGNSQYSSPHSISRAYHEAKSSGDYPELVNAVEALILGTPQKQTDEAEAVSQTAEPQIEEKQQAVTEASVVNNSIRSLDFVPANPDNIKYIGKLTQGNAEQMVAKIDDLAPGESVIFQCAKIDRNGTPGYLEFIKSNRPSTKDPIKNRKENSKYAIDFNAYKKGSRFHGGNFDYYDLMVDWFVKSAKGHWGYPDESEIKSSPDDKSPNGNTSNSKRVINMIIGLDTLSAMDDEDNDLRKSRIKKAYGELSKEEKGFVNEKLNALKSKINIQKLEAGGQLPTNAWLLGLQPSQSAIESIKNSHHVQVSTPEQWDRMVSDMERNDQTNFATKPDLLDKDIIFAYKGQSIVGIWDNNLKTGYLMPN